jgi:hypothetical protein
VRYELIALHYATEDIPYHLKPEKLLDPQVSKRNLKWTHSLTLLALYPLRQRRRRRSRKRPTGRCNLSLGLQIFQKSLASTLTFGATYHLIPFLGRNSMCLEAWHPVSKLFRTKTFKAQKEIQSQTCVILEQ